MAKTEDMLIDVFVRLCADTAGIEDPLRECREMSFRIPDGFPQLELLGHGWAIDGHTA